MTKKSIEIKNFEQLDAFVTDASASELHKVALEHASCWETQDYCESDEMFFEETSELSELIFTRILGAPNVASETLLFALTLGYQSAWHRAYLSSIIMESPAITSEILLQIQVDDLIEDVAIAEGLIFHTLSNPAVVLHAIDDFPDNILNQIVYQKFRDQNTSDEERASFKTRWLQKLDSHWKEFSVSESVPTADELIRFQEYLELSQ